MMQELAARLADVVAIPITPFRDGEIDFATHANLLNRMITAGIRVITPNGNTSEFYSLRPDERKSLIVATGQIVGDRAEVLVGIGLDASTAIEDGRAARDAGARMVMIHQPVHPYVSRQGWIDYHVAIANALPDMGIVLYIKKTNITSSWLSELGNAAPNVIGVKYAVPDPVVFARIRREVGAERFTWIAGLAEPYAPSYAAHGATGFTSGLVSVNPHLSLDLRDALRRGDFAAATTLTESIARFEELRAADSSADNVSAIKEALAQLGLARRDVRSPSSEVSATTRASIAEILREWELERPLTESGAQTPEASA